MLAPSGSDLSLLKPLLLDAPQHAAAMLRVANKHPVFGDACRLGSRWLHAHLLHEALPHEALELLVTFALSSAEPYAPPASPFSAFLRVHTRLCSVHLQVCERCAANDWARR